MAAQSNVPPTGELKIAQSVASPSVESQIDSMGNPIAPVQTPPPIDPKPASTPEPKIEAQQNDPTPETNRIEDETTTVDDFLIAAGKTVKKAIESKPADEPKTDDEKLQTTPSVQPTDKPGTPAQPAQRNYDEIDEDLRPIFKKLHNEPFNALVPIIKERKTLKADITAKEQAIAERDKQITDLKAGRIPDSYFAHEKAYILTPEFENAANTAIKAEQIYRHWTTELQAVENGKATYQQVLIGANGDLQLSQPIPVDPSTKINLQNYMTFAQQQLISQQAKTQTIAQGYLDKHGQAINAVKQFENTAFPMFNDPVNGKNLEPMVKDTVKNLLPSAFQNNPLAQALAKSVLVIRALSDANAALQKNGGQQPAAQPLASQQHAANGKKALSAEDQAKLQPTSREAVGGGSIPEGGEDVTIDDFKAVKAGIR